MTKDKIFHFLKKIFPVAIKRNKPNPLCEKSVKAEKNEVLNASNWWKENKYAKTKRNYIIRWFGKDILKIPYYQTIKKSYLKPADDIIYALENLQKEKIVQNLNENSKVFEPGCNVGRNLMYIQNKFNCYVFGLDISKEAINLAKKIWEKRKRNEFISSNILNSNFLKKLPDNYFDISLTRWFLIHIPYSEEKINFIKELKRVSKTLLVFEPVFDEENIIEYYDEKRYCLSKDNWKKYYDLQEFIPGKKHFKVNTSVFYSTK